MKAGVKLHNYWIGLSYATGSWQWADAADINYPYNAADFPKS